MKALKALVWKEVQTLKYVWIAGLLLFNGLGFWPIFFGSGIYGTHPSQSVAGISLCLGAVYCVILAISLICQDFQRPLEYFWKARPIRVSQIIGIKYALGLITVFFVSFVPLVLALAFEGRQDRGLDVFKLLTHSSDFEVHILLYHTLSLILIFSVCFLMAALVRKAVETALLSFAAILIIYFFPVVFPPLENLSVINLINTWDDSVGLFKPEVLENDSSRSEFARLDHHLAFGSFVFAFNRVWWVFAASMVSLALLALVATVSVLNRNWSFSLNQRSLAWSLASVSLLLFGAASFEVGTNLECERVIKSPREISIEGIVQDAGRGILVYETKFQDSMHLGFQQFDLNKEETLGRSIEDPWTIGSRHRYGGISYSWDSKSPKLLHYLARDIEVTKYDDPTRLGLQRNHLALATVDFGIPESATPISRIDLKPLMIKDLDSFIETSFVPGLAQIDDRSLATNLSLRKYLYRFDLDSEGHPQPDGMITEAHEDAGHDDNWRGEIESITVHLPRIPGLSPREKLRVWSELQGAGQRALNGELLAMRNEYDRVQVFELDSMNDDRAIFLKRSEIGKSPIEQLLHHGAWDLRLFDKYLAVIHSGGLTLYDVSDPNRPVQVGHYNSGIDHLNTVVSLGDGRILAAGNHLHVIRLPERGRS